MDFLKFEAIELVGVGCCECANNIMTGTHEKIVLDEGSPLWRCTSHTYLTEEGMMALLEADHWCQCEAGMMFAE